MDRFEGFPILLAIFYSEFHATHGPQVVYEVPEGFTVPPLEPYLHFDSISEYIIPKSLLCNRLVSISTPHYKVIGYPVSIENSKYERNALIFNLCFVFEKNAETECYEQIVKKMARTFRALEVESEFLSKSETKKELQNILEQLVEDLNYYSECQIPINDANTINLKLFPIYPDPPPVRDFQVPVCIIDLEMVMDKYCDLTMRRVVPRINGVNTIKKISELADVRVDLARSCVQHLLYYGCVKLVDIFQFSNVYAPKSHLNSMLNNIEAQNNCIDFVTLNGYPPVSFDRIFSLYCALKHELSVKDWIEDNEVWNHHIDVRINAIRRFFIYGVLKGYIFRIHKYPLIMQSSAVVEEELGYINGTIKEQKSYGGGMAGLVSSSVGKSVSSINYIPNNNFSISNIKRFLDGKHCFDELCTMFDCSSKELEELLKEKDKEKEICLRFLSF